MTDFDWKNPDYIAVYQRRLDMLAKLRADPSLIPGVRAWYRDHPDDLINDWGMTYDPRNADVGGSTKVPFLLFPKQREFVRWTVERWRGRRRGLAEKSRDMGVSWLSVATAAAIGLTHEAVTIGFGSRDEDSVDKIGDPDSLFWKLRFFLENLPPELTGGWRPRDGSHMRVTIPLTGSVIKGDAGDNIGRGGRAAIYFVDEAASLKRPDQVEAALSQTTNCRIDVSTPRGMANPFAQRRFDAKTAEEDIFTFHWRAQPLDARIVTHRGYVRMGDLKVGDEVMGPKGRPVRVLGIFPKGPQEIFEVGFSDGARAQSCEDHLWEVIPSRNQRKERKHITETKTLRDIRRNFASRDPRGFKRHEYQIPITASVEFEKGGPLPLDPYVMGAILGDGSIPTNDTRPIVMALPECDVEIASLMGARLPSGCSLKHDGGLAYRISSDGTYRTERRGRQCPVHEALRSLGLFGRNSHTKFIPAAYLTASASERLDLLRGLMDTDGGVCRNNPGAARFSTVSEALRDGMVFLAQSLGGVATVRNIRGGERDFPGGRRHECSNSYVVEVRLPPGINPFLMGRKARDFLPAARPEPRRSIISFQSVGVKECQCIQVEGGLYLTDDFVVTHNCDPRKDDAWYAAQIDKLDPVTVAQEIDLSYTASASGILIPAAWVQAAVDADRKLGVTFRGSKAGALDVADEGVDLNAFCTATGMRVDDVQAWSGKGDDIFGTVQKAFGLCDDAGLDEFWYDADGLGAGVRGDARVINDERARNKVRKIKVEPFRGSGAVHKPDDPIPTATPQSAEDRKKARKNGDYFLNAKAQGWWNLRVRFQRTFRAVEAGELGHYHVDDLICLNGKMPALSKVIMELSQPTYEQTVAGKIQVVKTPDGTKSPNYADSIMIRFAPRKTHFFEAMKGN